MREDKFLILGRIGLVSRLRLRFGHADADAHHCAHSAFGERRLAVQANGGKVLLDAAGRVIVAVAGTPDREQFADGQLGGLLDSPCQESRDLVVHRGCSGW